MYLTAVAEKKGTEQTIFFSFVAVMNLFVQVSHNYTEKEYINGRGVSGRQYQ